MRGRRPAQGRVERLPPPGAVRAGWDLGLVEEAVPARAEELGAVPVDERVRSGADGHGADETAETERAAELRYEYLPGDAVQKTRDRSLRYIVRAA